MKKGFVISKVQWSEMKKKVRYFEGSLNRKWNRVRYSEGSLIRKWKSVRNSEGLFINLNMKKGSLIQKTALVPSQVSTAMGFSFRINKPYFIFGLTNPLV